MIILRMRSVGYYARIVTRGLECLVMTSRMFSKRGCIWRDGNCRDYTPAFSSRTTNCCERSKTVLGVGGWEALGQRYPLRGTGHQCGTGWQEGGVVFPDLQNPA